MTPKYRVFVNGKMYPVCILSMYPNGMSFAGYIVTDDGVGEIRWTGAQLMSWTGYKTPDGIDIYEGDIVELPEYEDTGCRYEVVWGKFDDCCVTGETWILKTIGSELSVWNPTVYYHAEDARVVGNTRAKVS